MYLNFSHLLFKLLTCNSNINIKANLLGHQTICADYFFRKHVHQLSHRVVSCLCLNWADSWKIFIFSTINRCLPVLVSELAPDGNAEQVIWLLNVKILVQVSSRAWHRVSILVYSQNPENSGLGQQWTSRYLSGWEDLSRNFDVGRSVPVPIPDFYFAGVNFLYLECGRTCAKNHAKKITRKNVIILYWLQLL